MTEMLSYTTFRDTTFVGSIVPAFKGISDKFLPGAVPALDAPTFYPFSPMGGMFGFLGSSIGAILVCILTIVLHAPVIVFPSPIIMYFDGMSWASLVTRQVDGRVLLQQVW